MSATGDRVVPFHEIVPNASVRYALIDGVGYLCVRDIIMVMCCNEPNDTNDRKRAVKASKIWSRISEDFKTEVSTICRHLKFKGTGQTEQTVIQFQGALKLLMWLPGEQAKVLRSKAADILTRYFAGDEGLVAEIQANAESTAPINEAARAAVLTSDGESISKRRKTVGEMQEELALTKAAIASTREHNVTLREHIELKRELYGVEMDYFQNKSRVELTHEQEMLKIVIQRNTQELDHKKALKALEAELEKHEVPEPPPADLSGYITVYKVYYNHRAEFSGVGSKANVDRLLKLAGLKASNAYRANTGLMPVKNKERGIDDINYYPPDAEELIMESLRGASRDILAGNKQRSIEVFLSKPGDSQLQISFTP